MIKKTSCFPGDCSCASNLWEIESKRLNRNRKSSQDTIDRIFFKFWVQISRANCTVDFNLNFIWHNFQLVTGSRCNVLVREKHFSIKLMGEFPRFEISNRGEKMNFHGHLYYQVTVLAPSKGHIKICSWSHIFSIKVEQCSKLRSV